MSTTTPNYGLLKYEGSDTADLRFLGPSMDIIDEELKKNYDALQNISYPVDSVNSKTGNVVLTGGDINTSDGKSIQEFKGEFENHLNDFENFKNNLKEPIFEKIGTFKSPSDSLFISIDINNEYDEVFFNINNLRLSSSSAIYFNLNNDSDSKYTHKNVQYKSDVSIRNQSSLVSNIRTFENLSNTREFTVDGNIKKCANNIVIKIIINSSFPADNGEARPIEIYANYQGNDLNNVKISSFVDILAGTEFTVWGLIK